MLLFIHAVFVFQSKSRHYTRGSQTMETFQYVNCDFWGRSGKFWKWHHLPQQNGHRIKTPSLKFIILVSSCWEKNSIPNNAHKLFNLSLVVLKSLIVGVAFFLATLYNPSWLFHFPFPVTSPTCVQLPDTESCETDGLELDLVSQMREMGLGDQASSSGSDQDKEEAVKQTMYQPSFTSTKVCHPHHLSHIQLLKI